MAYHHLALATRDIKMVGFDAGRLQFLDKHADLAARNTFTAFISGSSQPAARDPQRENSRVWRARRIPNTARARRYGSTCNGLRRRRLGFAIVLVLTISPDLQDADWKVPSMPAPC